MHTTPNLPNRKIIRLQNYDYSQNGLYYVTINIYNKQQLFGYVSEGKMILNQAREMVKQTLMDLHKYINAVEIIEYIVVPDHVHLIVYNRLNPTTGGDGAPPLRDTIRRFKTITAKKYCDGVTLGIYKPYIKNFWQRSYYEHIIRNELDSNEKRHYIQTNPLRYTLKNQNDA